MLLTIDVGNSNVVVAVYDNQKQRVFQQRFVTVKENVSDFYRDWVRHDLLPLSRKIELTAYCIGSVVPAITAEIIGIIESELKIKGVNVSTKTVPEFVVKLTDPTELGADFIATSVGAMAKYPLPIILADLGSATKISVLDSNGEFKGGIISPGIGISSEALTRFIPQLPAIKIEVPKKVIGNDTITSMQSGLLYGAIAMVEGLAMKIETELGMQATKVVTGGYAAELYQAMKDFIYDDFILNEGLYEIYVSHDDSESKN